MHCTNTIHSPQFGAIIAKVNFSLDRPDAGEKLALCLSSGVVGGGSGMTCAHVAAALRAMQSNGADLANKLAPLCRDLATNSGLIKECLSSFEQMLCEKALAGAGAA
jgi:hypothetical protein